MKTITQIKLLILSILFLVGCSGGETPTPAGTTTPTPSPTSTPTIRIVTGEWTATNGGAGGLTNEESFKNFQFEYEVEANNQTVKFELKSNDLDVALFLYKTNGEKLDVSGKGRALKDEKVLNAGVYRVVIMAERNGRGKFELSINALKKDIKRIDFKTIRSDNATWGDNGGGALVLGPKNGFYAFEVTEDNTFVDVEMESSDTEIGLFIYNSKSEVVARSYGNSNRSSYFVEKLNKGIYTVMASTAVRNTRGKYQVNVYGKVDKLIKREYVEEVNDGTFTNGKEAKILDFEITENNSLFDVELSSPNYSVGFEIVDSKGKIIGRGSNAKNVFDIVTVQKGIYSIRMFPWSPNSLAGTYKLITIGNFK